MWKRMVMLLTIAGCGGRGDRAKTTAFVESYDRAMTRIAMICREVSLQVVSGEPLTPGLRAAFIIVYGRAARDAKLDDAPASLGACRDGANDAFAKLRSATDEVLARASGNKFVTIALANAAVPAVEGALRELKIAAANCKRDAQDIDPPPSVMSSPYFTITPTCL